MKIAFSKYQGAGNDFIVIDNREEDFLVDSKVIARMCDRHFGIGADGLMLLEKPSGTTNLPSFSMRYFNSDGSQATMCGNGGRCMAFFAFRLGISTDNQHFTAVDGEHQALILSSTERCAAIALKMVPPSVAERAEAGWLVNTGVPHYIEEVSGTEHFDLERARELRKKYNANVSFIAHTADGLNIRTFERGIEAETLACGTGAVAAAVVNAIVSPVDAVKNPVTIHALGGDLQVTFDNTDTWLTGPVCHVFDGVIFV